MGDMVLRTVFTLDGGALTVAGHSPSQAPGSAISDNPSSEDGTIYDFHGGSVAFLDIAGDHSAQNDEAPTTYMIADGARTPLERPIPLQELDATGAAFGPVLNIHVCPPGAGSGRWGFLADGKLQVGKKYVKVSAPGKSKPDQSEIIPCFVAGTEILSDNGLQPVETISTGDMIWTQSSGFQPVLWAGRTAAFGLGDWAPIWFDAGTIGNSKPMRLSPNHHILFPTNGARLPGSYSAVLIAARCFLGMPNVIRAPVPRVDYFHVMFAHHEIVQSDGCLTESFLPSRNALSGIGEDNRRKVLQQRAGLTETNGAELYPAAAPLLCPEDARRALRLSDTHGAHDKSLVDAA